MTELTGYYFWLLRNGIKLKETRQFSWGEFCLLPPRLCSHECTYTANDLWRTATERCLITLPLHVSEEKLQLRVCVIWNSISHPSQRSCTKLFGSFFNSCLSTQTQKYYAVLSAEWRTTESRLESCHTRGLFALSSSPSLKYAIASRIILILK